MAKKIKPVEFLLDIHTEPFPARFVPPALDQLKAGAEKYLAGRLEHGEIAVSGTLRHLILTVKSVAPKGLDKTERDRSALGSIALENYEREYAFGEAEIRLLTTVASSMALDIITCPAKTAAPCRRYFGTCLP